MGLLDSVFSIGGDLLSGFLNNEAAEDRQNDAQNFSAEQYAKRYQTTVKDMQAAGLNPMLAYGGISGSSPTSSAASSAGIPPLGAAYNQARMASAQVANVNADTENKRAQANLIEAQTAQAFSSAGQAYSQTTVNNNNASKIIQEIENLKSDNVRINRFVDLLSSQIGLTGSQTSLTRAQEEQARSIISKVIAETKLVNFDVDAALKMENFGREYNQLRPIIELIRSVVGSRYSK